MVKRKHRSACKCMNIIPPDSSTKLVQTDTAALCNTTIDVAVGPSSIADTVKRPKAAQPRRSLRAFLQPT
ncbi:hypothetical protein V5799_026430 [Amblyomma americanum]|uniref:Uncharacterized protein n=1 Tax=Amblyomma americanum TaxID=6943 RepID=A0AAQ4DIL1_AMBAM